jgi:hypothetical protein
MLSEETKELVNQYVYLRDNVIKRFQEYVASTFSEEKYIIVLPNKDNIDYQKYVCLTSIRDSLPLVCSQILSLTLDFALLDCPNDVETISEFVSKCRVEIEDEEVCNLFLTILDTYERDKKGRFGV